MFLLFFSFMACMGPKVPPKPEIGRTKFSEVKRIVVLTPGITIEAEDNSFVLQSGVPKKSPFTQGGECLIHPTAEDATLAEPTGAVRVRIKLSSSAKARLDVKRDFYYGLLSLCGAPDAAVGAAVREAGIQLTSKVLKNTAGGLASVIYEDYLWDGGSSTYGDVDGQFIENEKGKIVFKPSKKDTSTIPKTKKGKMVWAFGPKVFTPKSWVLWVSQTPFPPKDRDAEGLTAAVIAKKVDERPIRYWEQEKKRIDQEILVYGSEARFHLAQGTEALEGSLFLRDKRLKFIKEEFSVTKSGTLNLQRTGDGGFGFYGGGFHAGYKKILMPSVTAEARVPLLGIGYMFGSNSTNNNSTGSTEESSDSEYYSYSNSSNDYNDYDSRSSEPEFLFIGMFPLRAEVRYKTNYGVGVEAGISSYLVALDFEQPSVPEEIPGVPPRQDPQYKFLHNSNFFIGVFF